MHANEREPQETHISLQTYMHIERERKIEREGKERRRMIRIGKDPKTEIKNDMKVTKREKGKMQRWKREG